MLRALVVSVVLVASGCSTGPMTPCVTTPMNSCVDQADQQGKDVAAAIVGGIVIIALAKMVYELVPLAMYIHQRGHSG